MKVFFSTIREVQNREYSVELGPRMIKPIRKRLFRFPTGLITLRRLQGFQLYHFRKVYL